MFCTKTYFLNKYSPIAAYYFILVYEKKLNTDKFLSFLTSSVLINNEL